MPDETDRKKTGVEDGLKWWVRYGCVPITVAIIAGLAAIAVAILTRIVPQASADPLPESTRSPAAVVTLSLTDTVVVTSTDAPAPPTIQLSPAEGGPGTLVTVAGEDWGPAETVFVGLDDPSDGQALQVDPTAVGVAATVADTRDFIAAFTFPSDARWAGLSTVFVIAQSVATGEATSAEFRITATRRTATDTTTPTATPTPCGPPFNWPVYVVQPGDTLFSIARASGTSLQQLMLANCLASDRIHVGQPLYVPRLPPAPTFTLTSTPTPSPTSTPTPSLTPTRTPSATSTSTSTGTPTNTPTTTPTPTRLPIGQGSTRAGNGTERSCHCNANTLQNLPMHENRTDQRL